MGSAPSAFKTLACALKSPCNDKMPTLVPLRGGPAGVRGKPLPATGLKQFLFGQLGDVEARHRLAEFLAGVQ